MGQKVNPVGLRLGINRTWDSRWFADPSYADLLHEDLRLRNYLFDRLSQAGVSRVIIERPAKKARITIHTARPGVVIGKKGADIEKLRTDLSKMTGSEVNLNIVEIRKPELDATLVAESIAQQLERRVAFRRAMKRAVQSAMRLGAGGLLAAEGHDVPLREDLPLWGIVAFIGFLFAVKKLGWDALTSGMRDREASENRLIGEAETLRQQAAAQLTREKGNMEALDEHVREVLAEADRDAAHTRSDIRSVGEREAAAIRARSLVVSGSIRPSTQTLVATSSRLSTAPFVKAM